MCIDFLRTSDEIYERKRREAKEKIREEQCREETKKEIDEYTLT